MVCGRSASAQWRPKGLSGEGLAADCDDRQSDRRPSRVALSTPRRDTLAFGISAVTVPSLAVASRSELERRNGTPARARCGARPGVLHLGVALDPRAAQSHTLPARSSGLTALAHPSFAEANDPRREGRVALWLRRAVTRESQLRMGGPLAATSSTPRGVGILSSPSMSTSLGRRLPPSIQPVFQKANRTTNILRTTSSGQHRCGPGVERWRTQVDVSKAGPALPEPPPIGL